MMYDWLHALLKKIDYNRYLTTGILASVLLLGFAFTGCESTVASMTTPGQQVSRLELAGEAAVAQGDFEGREAALVAEAAKLAADVKAYNAQVELAVAELDRQDALKVQALEFVGVVLNAATGGAIDSELLAYALGLSGGLLCIGAYADKHRTDAVLEAEKSAKKTPTA